MGSGVGVEGWFVCGGVFIRLKNIRVYFGFSMLLLKWSCGALFPCATRIHIVPRRDSEEQRLD